MIAALEFIGWFATFAGYLVVIGGLTLGVVALLATFRRQGTQ